MPSIVEIKKENIDCSTENRESPFSIPSSGTSFPVYLVHLSGMISVHPF